MSGVMPPPVFNDPPAPERSRQAEQRFYESCDHGFAIGLGAALAALRAVSHRGRGRPAPIDKARAAAFKIGLRSMEPAPHDRADPCCRC